MFVAQTEAHSSKITAISFTADANQVAIGFKDGCVQVNLIFSKLKRGVATFTSFCRQLFGKLVSSKN